MSFDWNGYLALARRLAPARDEASLRSAVSRSYYCVFNLALLRAASNHYRTPDDGIAGSHENLWSLYGRNIDPACRRLGLVGPRMKRRRVKADYRSHIDKLSDEVQDAMADAEDCVAILSNLKRDLPMDLPRRFSH